MMRLFVSRSVAEQAGLRSAGEDVSKRTKGGEEEEKPSQKK